MRNLKLMVTGLALAGLAGCGTAYAAASPSASWVAPSSSPTATSAATSAETSVPASPSSEAPSPEAPAAPSSEAPAAPSSEAPTPSSEAPSSSPAAAHHGGPANSLMKTGTKDVALTFDDGPDPVQTPALLDLLGEQGIKATFCLVGQQAAAHPDLVRRIVEEGHTLCNHSWNHSLTLGKGSPAAIRKDLQKTNDAIHAAVPDAEIKYMRAPGGNFTPALVKAASDLGMTSIYWDLDPRDWDHPAGETDATHTARVISTVKKHTTKGAIILSHDYGQPDTIKAYRTLIPWLKTRFTLIALPVDNAL
ncbi:hypothetical protein GCM10010435_54060 [Winogradskya consettensis]|uniref:NodB homology domain-containing protein n=1 Tax=Winogradskya consettensis TaxID=113560 RepID=A0A919VQ30_9ACTN|nr:polysaccharide deacetylase family protein [Actinoplanes consettensis]GIM71470.1 hypothetical protein Aco04nite_25390 [Actinoplanes consettensis]